MTFKAYSKGRVELLKGDKLRDFREEEWYGKDVEDTIHLKGIKDDIFDNTDEWEKYQ